MTSRTQINHIDGVISIVLASSAVDLGCDLGLGQTKTYKIGIWVIFKKMKILQAQFYNYHIHPV
jgi:hypothetical protein